MADVGVAVDELDRHRAVERDLRGAPRPPHAAFADRLEEGVAARQPIAALHAAEHAAGPVAKVC